MLDERSDFSRWSEPVIFDCLRNVYQRHMADTGGAVSLTRLHAKAWNALLKNDLDRFDEERTELSDALFDAGLGEGHMSQADAVVIHELKAIVTARFRKAPRLAKQYFDMLAEFDLRLDSAVLAAPALAG